jgi:DNA-binding GntR family transcriptional regulator
MLDPTGSDDGLAASQRVAAYLREAILDGTIAPGQRIRQEEVAERLGASRLPVREALRMLELEGLTEFVVNKGARVPLLDTEQLHVVYRMRERIEPLALTESLPHLSGEQIDQLSDIQERIEQNDDIGEFLRLDRQLHLLTYSGCQFPELLGTVTRLWNSTQHFRRSFMTLPDPDRRWVVNFEHALLLDAIRRRDAVDAERFLTGHLRRTRVELSQSLDGHGSH